MGRGHAAALTAAVTLGAARRTERCLKTYS
jgi:hypothetical protein